MTLTSSGLTDYGSDLVVGSGSTAGHALITNDEADAVSFTGSTETGQYIAETVSQRGAPIQT
ncbi:MAG: NAD-dependent aldehyde dehydrogenase, partial [Haloquadratum sp. J07HQX50]